MTLDLVGFWFHEWKVNHIKLTSNHYKGVVSRKRSVRKHVRFMRTKNSINNCNISMKYWHNMQACQYFPIYFPLKLLLFEEFVLSFATAWWKVRTWTIKTSKTKMDQMWGEAYTHEKSKCNKCLWICNNLFDLFQTTNLHANLLGVWLLFTGCTGCYRERKLWQNGNYLLNEQCKQYHCETKYHMEGH